MCRLTVQNVCLHEFYVLHYVKKFLENELSLGSLKKIYKSVLRTRTEKFYFRHLGITSIRLPHFPKFVLRENAG
jgi:hypothetical protein